MLDNACPSRITAAAGTRLAGTKTSLNNVIIIFNERTLQPKISRQSFT